MPSKNRIAAYPPDAIYQRLKDFAKEQGVSESKALIRILGERFDIPTEIGQPVIQQYVTLQHFEKELAELRELISGLKNEPQKEKVVAPEIQEKELPEELQSDSPMSMSPNDLKSELNLSSEKEASSKANEDLSPRQLEAKLESESKSQSPSEKEAPSKANDGLTNHQLEERLGKKKGFARGKKYFYKGRENELVEKLRELDPEGKGWRWDDEQKKWYSV